MKMDKEKVTQTEEQQEVPAEKTELETVKEELEAIKAEKDELYDKYLRTLAEYDNFRKRSQREKDAIYGDATAESVKKLLPVLDSFERALNYECKDEEFKKGISLIQNTLKEVFDSMGVKEIPDVGEQFDPNLHEAVMHTEDPTYGENVITDCYRKGYTLNDKVIRFSMVIVAN
ncbi:MAG: nucleotide exchange factor GrpE [Oscillospiraceae bacterium]|nr:nucleotide exchange factor GrpE [Oscillospiraceae bacterium]